MAGEKLTKATGYFVVVYGDGWIWPETLSHRAKDSRRIMGEIMVGIKQASTVAEGWQYARRKGYVIEKVDVFPAGSAVLQSRPSN